MNCLDNLIGIKGCVEQVPESGLYINSLPGMSSELADKIANSEQVTFKGVWEDIKKRAFQRLNVDAYHYLVNDSTNEQKVNFREIIYQTKPITKYTRNLQIVLAGAEYRGVYVKMPEAKYLQLYLRNIQVYSYTTITTVLKVFDVNDGEELYSQDIELSIGLNTIDVLKQFDLRFGVLDLFIAVDCSGFNSIKTYIENYYWYDSDWNCADSNFYNRHDLFTDIRPAKLTIGQDALFENIDRSGSGFGVAVGAEVKCSIEGFICENRKSLTYALWYLLGIEMLTQKISSSVGSSRVNYFTHTNLEQTDNTRKIYEKQYTAGLKKALDTVPLSGICFDCEDKFDVTTGSVMP